MRWSNRITLFDRIPKLFPSTFSSSIEIVWYSFSVLINFSWRFMLNFPRCCRGFELLFSLSCVFFLNFLFFFFIFQNKPLILTLLWRRSLSYRNQSIDFLCKLMDWIETSVMKEWKASVMFSFPCLLGYIFCLYQMNLPARMKRIDNVKLRLDNL